LKLYEKLALAAEISELRDCLSSIERHRRHLSERASASSLPFGSTQPGKREVHQLFVEGAHDEGEEQSDGHRTMADPPVVAVKKPCCVCDAGRQTLHQVQVLPLLL
jgi:hypothetical protein